MKKYTSIKMEADIHRQLKGACLLAGCTMQDVIDEMGYISIQRLRDGWKPIHAPRDMTTALQELP